MSRFFTSGGPSIGVSASASVLSMNIQDWSPLGWAGWISLQSKGLSRVFSNTTVQKHQFFGAQPSLWPNSHIYPYMTTGKAIALTIWTFVGKGMSLLFNTLSRLEVLVSQSCLTLCNPMDCSLPGSSVHGFLQARILEWVAIPFSRGSSQPRIWTWSPALQADLLPSEPSGKPQGLKSGPSVRAHWSWRKPGCVRGKGDCQRADWELWTEESKDKHTTSLPELSPAACWFYACCCHVPVGL